MLISCLYPAYILPISCLYPAYILPISCLYPAYILPISCLYPAYILPISCLYPAYIMSISCLYPAYILLISCLYPAYIPPISCLYPAYILPISCLYPAYILPISCLYPAYILPISIYLSQTIKAANISTVRKLAKPPSLIMRIMDCVLILFRRRLNPVQMEGSTITSSTGIGAAGKGSPMVLRPSWSESLKMMMGGTFLQNLMNYNKDLINEEMVELLEPYLHMEDYNMLSAKKVCSAICEIIVLITISIIIPYIFKYV